MVILDELKFYQTSWFAWLMILLFWPVGLFLMFKYKHHNTAVKIIVSCFCMILLMFQVFFTYVIGSAFKEVFIDDKPKTDVETVAQKLPKKEKDTEKEKKKKETVEEKVAEPVENTETEKPNEDTTQETTTPVQTQPIDKSYSIKSDIESIVDGFQTTSIKEIKVNENMGTDAPDDYIALVYLSFDAQNRKSTTKNVIDLYNNELGAQVAKIKEVNELVIFWEVPYHLNNINAVKATLKRQGDDMYFESTWIAPALK